MKTVFKKKTLSKEKKQKSISRKRRKGVMAHDLNDDSPILKNKEYANKEQRLFVKNMKMLQKKMSDVALIEIQKKGKRKDPLAFLNKHKKSLTNEFGVQDK